MTDHHQPETYALSPFVRALGAHLVRVGEGSAELAFDPVDTHENTWGAVHGGVLMTLLDVAMSHAARSLDAAARGAVTVDLGTQFQRPAVGALRGIGRCVHATRTLAFCEGEVIDAQGAVVARAHGTFKLLRRADLARRPSA